MNQVNQSKTETYKLTGKIVARSKAAILFAIDPNDLDLSMDEFLEGIKAKNSDIEQHWFPLSQTKQMHETFSLVNGTYDSIVVSIWIMKQKGMVD